MNEMTALTEYLAAFGTGGLIFIMWYFYHKSSTTQFDKILESQAQRAQENFKLLQDMISSNLLQNEKLERIETKIDNNRWCPYVKYILQNKEHE